MDEWKKRPTGADVWSQDQRFAHRNGTWKNIIFLLILQPLKSFRRIDYLAHIQTAGMTTTKCENFNEVA